MTHEATRAAIHMSWMAMQSKIDAVKGRRAQKRMSNAMMELENLGRILRRQDIFEAGASANSPEPVFEGEALNSVETITFRVGYGSTH